MQSQDLKKWLDAVSLYDSAGTLMLIDENRFIKSNIFSAGVYDEFYMDQDLMPNRRDMISVNYNTLEDPIIRFFRNISSGIIFLFIYPNFDTGRPIVFFFENCNEGWLNFFMTQIEENISTSHIILMDQSMNYVLHSDGYTEYVSVHIQRQTVESLEARPAWLMPIK